MALRVLVVRLALLVVVSVTGTARAQAGDIELEASAPLSPAPAARQYREPISAVAKAHFDAQRWSEAAVLFHALKSDPTASESERQFAEYALAISLFRLEFHYASFIGFSSIAENSQHLKFADASFWLAKLATVLPETAGVHQRLGKYSPLNLARYQSPAYRSIYLRLNYLLGRQRYETERYEEAIRLFATVDRTSPQYVQSRFLMAASYIRIRRSVPALMALQQVLTALDDGVVGVSDETRMSSLAQYATISARIIQKLVPINQELERLIRRYADPARDQEWFALVSKTRYDMTALPPKLHAVWNTILRDRRIQRGVQYVEALDKELQRFHRSAPVFRGSALGLSTYTSLSAARSAAMREAGELALARLRERHYEVFEHLRGIEQSFMVQLHAFRNLLDDSLPKGAVSKREAKIFGVVTPDDEHILWPFDGEYWRDEIGTYQQVIQSACGR